MNTKLSGEVRIDSGLSTLGEPMSKKEWSYFVAKEELVNHPNYAKPVIMKKMGKVYVKGYEKSYLFGFIKTTIKTEEETVWDTGYTIFQIGDKNV